MDSTHGVKVLGNRREGNALTPGLQCNFRSIVSSPACQKKHVPKPGHTT